MPHDFEQGNCPACGVSWQGQPIPKKWQDDFGATHYSRVIGVEYHGMHPDHYDGVSEYRCPDCGARFNRWTGAQLERGETVPRYGRKEST